MNIILIVSDTLRRDFLGCYGNDWISTEHIDNFAEKSLVFDKYYVASYPTIPNRADIFTGKFTFNYLGWAPLPENEVVLAETLARQASYYTKAVVDTPFFERSWARSDGYDRGFQDFERIRGQGRERLDTNLIRRYEIDYCAPATMLAASRWLERNYKETFFLYVDTWDPHEPWDPPKWYANRYYPGKEDEKAEKSFSTTVEYEETMKRLRSRGSHGTPGMADNITEVELNRLRALYAGEVTMVDRWAGMLLQKIEDLGLFENTAIIFTSDHGSYHGEHGYVTKRPHLYEEVAHIPLIIRLPESEGTQRGHCDFIVQPPDLMPTLLELAKIEIPKTVQGKSILPVIQEEENSIREAAVSCQSLLAHPVNRYVTVTTKDWALITVRTSPDQPEIGPQPDSLSIQVKTEPELFHLPTDPKQINTLYSEKKENAEELHSKMIQFLQSIGTKKDLLVAWEKM